MSAIASQTAPWRKRSLEDDLNFREVKRPRLNYFRLASESSRDSEDNESVLSVQGRETDVVRDTSDTDTKTDCSSIKDEYEVEIEYEVASNSEGDNYLSDSSEPDIMMAAAAVAAVIYDTSYEGKGLTDSEDSDSSSIDTSITRSYSTCIQCKFANNNPLFRYCEKCFQQSCRQCKMRKTYKCFPLCNSCYKDRKKDFPPRPRGFRKKKKTVKRDPPVKLDTLRNCLSGLSQMSQDSGIGSSQECPQLDLHQIVVPQRHLTGTSTDSAVERTSSVEESTAKSNGSSSSDLSSFEVRTVTSDSGVETKSDVVAPALASNTQAQIEENIKASESSDLCIFCNSAPKDSIFLHTNIAHMCCCYKCAKRTLSKFKRCPICNGAVNKVVKIFGI